MKIPFRQGDRVFDIRYGWGEWRRANQAMYKTKDGLNSAFWHYYSHDDIGLASFTEYTLEGFSQERPFDIKKGEWAYFWDDDDDSFLLDKLEDYDSETGLYFVEGDIAFQNCSKERPPHTLEGK